LISSWSRRDRRQPGAHRVGRAPQQVTQEFERKVNTKPEDLGEFVIRLCAGDDAGIAGVGKARAGVVCELSNDLAFAAVDDHVGHGFRQVHPARNREQVLLPPGAGDLHEVARPQAARLRQHAAGHRDFLVPRKVLDDFERRVVDRRQATAELGSGLAFDPGDQKTQHVVEDLDLIVVEASTIVQEQVSHLAKRRNPLLRRAAPDGVFEFGDDGMVQLLQHAPMPVFDTRPARGARFAEIPEVP
jgi:hypothetical protein